jgi:NAD(P)-dependent dehydrogenase (short-subunit alcohol dehydrogenase family)
MNASRTELQGKTALVTGSTSGIGKATAAALARLGATVIVTGRDAGRGDRGPTADLDAATFDGLFAANVRSAYLLTAALAPAMAARGSGSIVNLDSMAGAVGLAGARPTGRRRRPCRR